MSGTLLGYLTYRLQDKIERETNGKIRLNYQEIVKPIQESLLELSKDMGTGEFIELPDGSILIMGKKIGR